MKRPARFLFILTAAFLFIPGCKEILEKFTVSRIDLSPACAVANINQAKNFTAKAYDKDGNQLGDATFKWSSSDTSVAQVSDSGAVFALMGGNARITAAGGEASAQSLLFVNPLTATHNCRDYEWYQTQMGTGSAAGNNCGPTSTHMAIKWFRNSTTDIPSVKEIRNRRPNDGGWWYTIDISESLTHYGVPFATRVVSNQNDILACLQRGRIVLLCLQMKWIAFDRHPFYDRYYSFNSGHFLIVKGWCEDGMHFIVYDPNSWDGDYYADGTAMGRNRFYKRSELVQAVTNWWSFAFEIGAGSTESTVDLAAVPIGRAGPDQLPQQ